MSGSQQRSVIDLIIDDDDDEPEAATIYVDGTLDGRPHRFLLDTGAASTELTFHASTAGYRSIESGSSSGVIAAADFDRILVPSLTVGSLSWSALTLARSRPGGNPRGSLLGMDLLGSLCCAFDFGAATMRVGPLDGAEWRPLRMDLAGHPYLDVGLAVGTGSAVWDTGAALTIADTGFIARHQAEFTAAGTSIGTDATGASVQTPMFVQSGCRIGGIDFPPHRVAAVDLSAANATIEWPMDLILGYNLLRHARWTFDFPADVGAWSAGNDAWLILAGGERHC